MTRVRRPSQLGAVTGRVPVARRHLVCAYADRTHTICDVATRQTPGTRAKDSDRSDTCQFDLAPGGAIKQIHEPS